MLDNMGNFRRYLPSDLMENGISLQDIHFNEYIWSWHDALTVIDILIDKKIFILGGDVYSYIKNRYRPTGESWYVNPTSLIPNEDDLLKSKNVSMDYINTFIKKNGEVSYFSIVARFPMR